MMILPWSYHGNMDNLVWDQVDLVKDQVDLVKDQVDLIRDQVT